MSAYREDHLQKEVNALRKENEELLKTIDLASTHVSGQVWQINQLERLIPAWRQSAAWKITCSAMAGMWEGGRFQPGNPEHFSYRPEKKP